MPIVAVAGIAGGATALAAGGLTVFETIASIGAIVGGIGGLTGNKDLMKIGALAGLAGGVGAIAQSKGWIASGSAAQTASDAANSGNIQALTQSAAPGVENVARINNPSAFEAGMNPGVLETTSGMGSDLAQSGLAQNITSPNPVLNEGLMNAGATEPATSLINETAKDGFKLNMGVDSEIANKAIGAGAIDGYRAADGGIFGVLGKFGDFWKGMDKETKSMLGNFIGGAFDDEKKAKADYYKSAAATAQARLANASAVPNMNFKLQQNGPIWKPTSPVYNAPKPSGLFYAR